MPWTAPKTWTNLEDLVVDDFNTYIRDNQTHLKSHIELGNPNELTIATGAVTATQMYHTVDTEGDAASDDLDTISGGSEGDFIVVRAAHTDRTVNLTESGNMKLGGSSIALDSTEIAALLFNQGSYWILIGMASIYTDADAKAACVSDDVYDADWNGVTEVAPSKNAVYDKVELHEGSAAAHHAKYLNSEAVAAVEAAGLAIATGKTIKTVKTLTSDHTASGLTQLATAGENLVFGDFCYRKSDGKLWKAKGDAAATMPCLHMAIATISADADGEFLRLGIARDDTWDWTISAVLYISDGTAGALTETKPADSGDQIQAVAVAISADEIDFQPSPYIEAVP